MEFLGIVFTDFIFENFSRMKRSWREELQLPITIKRSFLSRVPINEKACSSDMGSKLFAKVISRFKSFSLNEYDLRILSSFFLIEMFDLRGKELKYAQELLLNHYSKPVQNSMRLQNMCEQI